MKDAEGLGGNWEIRNSRMYFFLRIMKKDKTEVDIQIAFTRFDNFV